MKFRLLLASAVLATASISAYADTFYVSPEGAGEKTGADEANAMDIAALRDHAKALTQDQNNTYIFAGGTYSIETCITFATKTAPTLVGNTNGERTVFDATAQNAETPASNYTAGIIYVQAATKDQSAAETKERPVKISNIDFCNLTNSTSKNGATGNGNKILSAIAIENSGYVEIEGCTFKNNKITTTQGGPAICSYRSTMYVRNCTFEGNTAADRGGAIMTASDNKEKGKSVFENCLFKHNSVEGNMGGAVFSNSIHSNTFVDCTFTGNSAAGQGSVLFCNGKDKDYNRYNAFINCTIADNPCTEGSVIMLGNGANPGQLYLINNIIVEKAEARAAEGSVISSNGTADLNLVSGGYNYLGVVENAPEGWAQTTDRTDKDYASIFGTHTLNANTGTIKPDEFVKGATSAEITAAIAEWPIPAGVTIATREGETSVGAGAFTQQQVSTGIADIANDADAVKVIALGDGNYTVAGYEGAVEVYSVSGARVLTAVAPELNLSGLASGVYIVRAGKTVAKVVR